MLDLSELLGELLQGKKSEVADLFEKYFANFNYQGLEYNRAAVRVLVRFFHMYQDAIFASEKTDVEHDALGDDVPHRRYSVFPDVPGQFEEANRPQTKLFILLQLAALVENVGPNATVTVYGTCEPEHKFFEFVQTGEGANMHVVCMQDENSHVDLLFDVAGHSDKQLSSIATEGMDGGDDAKSVLGHGVSSYVDNTGAEALILRKTNGVILPVDEACRRTHIAIGGSNNYSCPALKQASVPASAAMRDKILERVQGLAHTLRSAKGIDDSVKASLSVVDILMQERARQSTVPTLQ